MPSEFAPVTIQGRDIDDTWFNLLDYLFRFGREYYIDEGSYAGQKRLTFDFVSGFINYPHARPLAPRVPENSPLPPPTTDDEIEQYFANYLMDSELAENEEYKYGTWIVGGEYQLPKVNVLYNLDNPKNQDFIWEDTLPIRVPDQLEWVINHFQQKGYGNSHGVITIGYPESNFAYDIPYSNEMERRTSPCLRSIDFKVIENQLMTHCYFRCLTENTSINYELGGDLKSGTVHDLWLNYSEGKKPRVFGESNNKILPISIDHMMKAEPENIVSIKISGGLPLECGENQRFPVLDTNKQEIKLKKAKHLSKYFDRLLEPCGFDYDLGEIDSLDTADFLKSEGFMFRNLTLEHFKHLKDQGIDFSNGNKDKRKLNLSHYSKNEKERILASSVFLNEKVYSLKARKGLPRSLYISNEMAFFFGLWLADGWFNKYAARIAIADKKSHLKRDIKYWLLNEFNYIPSEEKRDGCVVLNIAHKTFVDLMKSMGFQHGAAEKSVPNIIYKFSKSKLNKLLDGWLSGDSGWSTSNQLIKSMSLIGKLIKRNFSYAKQDSKSVYFEKEDRWVESKDAFYMVETYGIRNIIFSNGVKYITRKIKNVDYLKKEVPLFHIGLNSEKHTFCCGDQSILTHNSWDLVNGWPTNMGGIALLNEYVAEHLEGVEAGPLAFSCKDLHSYGFAYDYVKARLGFNTKE